MTIAEIRELEKLRLQYKRDSNALASGLAALRRSGVGSVTLAEGERALRLAVRKVDEAIEKLNTLIVQARRSEHG